MTTISIVTQIYAFPYNEIISISNSSILWRTKLYSIWIYRLELEDFIISKEKQIRIGKVKWKWLWIYFMIGCIKKKISPSIKRILFPITKHVNIISDRDWKIRCCRCSCVVRITGHVFLEIVKMSRKWFQIKKKSNKAATARLLIYK